VTPDHFVGIGTLFVALAFGIVLEHLGQATASGGLSVKERWRPARGLGSRTRCVMANLAIAGIGAGALIPIALTMSLPLAMEREVPPRWFTQQVAALPPSATLLVLPYPSSPASSDAMVWQADAGDTFRQVGGFQLVPGQGGQVDHTAPGAAGAVLADLSGGSAGPSTSRNTLPAPTRSNLRLVRTMIKSHHVTTVVATSNEVAPPYAVGFMTAVLGETPHSVDGSWVWSQVDEDQHPSLHTVVPTLALCARGAHDPLVVAKCIMTSR
jgi:hypothetical protein